MPDYSLTGRNASLAIERGLAEADWYQSPVPRATLRQLMIRKNGPAIRDTLLLVVILVSTAFATTLLWGTWWAVIPYLVYAVFYGTSSDSRWHECGHGTAFRTDWMNKVVYEVASFMVMRESVVWRWSHTRHHSDTIIIGRDPEIQVPRPPNMMGLALSLINFGGYITYYPSLVLHAMGTITERERKFIPDSEFNKVYRNARICLAINICFICSAIIIKSWIPIFLFILPQLFGTWLMIVHNTLQHAGLAENVLDHRLNCRTVYMNPISRFIYWNMNYHIEHHIFPLVPYHALPKLHNLIKDDCPPVYPSIYSAWREVLPTLMKQVKDPTYFVQRKLPDAKKHDKEALIQSDKEPDEEGWVEVCAAVDLHNEDVMRFDHGQKTYAVYRDSKGKLYASDGICTHGNTHLGDGLVKDNTIECPKHNGRFNLSDGSPARAPICRGLTTYLIEDRNGRLWLNPEKAGGIGKREVKSYKLRVLSNKNVSTFIKELVLEPFNIHEKIDYIPGDYIQIDIPKYDHIAFSEFDIPEPFASVWERQGLFNLSSTNSESGRRNNYSMASNPVIDRTLKFNIRIALSPPGKDYPQGVGSSFLFSLKAGDTISAIGAFGDFHIKPTLKEMVYIGGGAGMAPIRAHIAQLFENESTTRKVSYWYGARSKQEIFYEDYFQKLTNEYPQFNFQLALSEAHEEDKWIGHKGFIHDVVFENYLKDHARPQGIEFYLCGPPVMVRACKEMLANLGVKNEQIAFDEY
jgi:Na+-transporting NADH:ubiquinone oxidoreductase subunit F